MAESMRVLELFSGIGGMHSALKLCGIANKVVAAYDVNTNANKIYQHNFPNTKVVDKGIEGLTSKTYDALEVGMILMSPPCQPFTRVGNKQDTSDARTNAFLHILDLLPRVSRLPSYLLLENVKGFETSQARERLVTTLKHCQYSFQEFLLTPLQFGIPNSRLRYFLIAKKQPLKFGFDTSTEVQLSLPECTADWLTYRKQAESDKDSNTTNKHKNKQCACGGSYSNNISVQSSANENVHLLNNTDKKGSPVSSTGNNNVDDDNGVLIKRRKLDNSVGDTSKTEPLESADHIAVQKSVTDISQEDNCVSENVDKESNSACLESNSVCLEDYGKNMRQTHEDQPDYGPVLKLKCFLEENCDTGISFSDYVLSEKDLRRFMVMDIINPCSTKTNCFTKRYGRFIEGAGSLVQMSKDVQVVMKASAFKELASAQPSSESWSIEQREIIRNLNVRFFTPREIANLLGFPKTFGFPEDVTTRQLYMALGNSLNVHVVAVLIKLMTLGDPNIS